jgi:hypothetical protein
VRSAQTGMHILNIQKELPPRLFAFTDFINTLDTLFIFSGGKPVQDGYRKEKQHV